MPEIIESLGKIKGKQGYYAKFRCSCGKEFVSRIRPSRPVKSCGCLVGSPKHRLSCSKEYRTWIAMKQRCDNPSNCNYKNYGSRGITYCKRWAVFENFLEDMGPKPEGLSLDRIDNDGNYEPRNCRWADNTVQVCNRRTSRNIRYEGKTQTATEWFRELKISNATFYRQLNKGLTAQEIFDKYKKT